MAADHKSTQLTNIDAGTHNSAGTYVFGPPEKPCFRGTLAFGAGVMAKSETAAMVRLPAGVIPYMCWLLVSESLGSSKIEIGIEGTAAKYRASATYTEATQWTPFMLEAALDDGALASVSGQDYSEEIWITNSADAAFPTTTGGAIELVFECIRP